MASGAAVSFLWFVRLLLSDGAWSCDTVIEQETEWGVTVEKRCTMYHRNFFGGYFTRRLCASVSCLSGGFIHPDVPLRAESCKAPLTPDSDPFRLQGAYSPHMFLSVRFFCFAQMLFFSFLLLSIQWFLSFVCVVTLQTRSGAYETSR